MQVRLAALGILLFTHPAAATDSFVSFATLTAILEDTAGDFGTPGFGPTEHDAARHLARGQALLWSGDPAAACPWLGIAALSPAVRARALRSLGEAQVRIGDHFEALRSLRLAARIDGDPISPSASLIARLIVRRGGTAWGSLRFSPTTSFNFSDHDEPRLVAAGGGRIVIATNDELLEAEGTNLRRLSVLTSRPLDLALGPRGAIVILLRDGQVIAEDPDQSGKFRDLPPARRARAVARDIRDDVLVLDSFGRLERRSPTGGEPEPIESGGVGEALDVAVDSIGRIHVLHRRGIARLTRDLVPIDVIPSETENYRWTGAENLAVDPIGGIYVHAGGLGVVYAFDPFGRLSGRIDPPSSDRDIWRSPRDFALTADGSVYVLSKRGAVQEYR